RCDKRGFPLELCSMGRSPESLKSVCVFCGASDAADPADLRAAGDLGRALAAAKLRLVYGGGGVGLMGACARAAHEAGGQVLGIIPDFLVGKERALETVRHEVVTSMHQRKQRFFEESDGFVILPGGIGTLEEIVELLSWRRLDLHHMPVVFYNPDGFWDPLFALFQHTVDAKLTPASFMGAWSVVETVDEIVPALFAGPKAGSDKMLTSIV
ncbi:MAG: LOG family protein, partial [Phenylobacterium sp.]